MKRKTTTKEIKDLMKMFPGITLDDFISLLQETTSMKDMKVKYPNNLIKT